MSNTINIKGVNQAILAAVWCRDNLTETEWDMVLSNTIFSNGDYNFRFNDPSIASRFALRWR
jgi:hypothetical protein